MRRLLAATVFSMTLFAVDPKTEKALLSVMDTWRQAMLTRDKAALDRLYTPDITYTHSNGKNETKAEAIDAVVNGKGKFESIDFSGTTVRVYGNTALVKGRVVIKTSTDGKQAINNLDILHVLVKASSGWQIVARQATRIVP